MGDLTLQHSGGGIDRLSQALFNASVDLNPHQIEAAVFALRSPLSKGVLLADEVGLGKTIEAGIVLCQYWAERKRQLLVICPASLRKQWALELEEKFNLQAVVLDSKMWREAQRKGLAPLRQKAVVIVSYAYATRIKEEIRSMAWDLVVIDEAHKLRNAYRESNKIGQAIRWATSDKGFSLKRTNPQDRPKGVHLDKLESLNIFGVRASYMATFKEYLKEEGVTPSDEILELNFETRANLPANQLKTLSLKDGYKDNQKMGFKRTHYPWLYEVPKQFENKIKPAHVVLDLYPRVESLATKGSPVQQSQARHQGKLNSKLFAVFDWDRIYLALLSFKLQRSWSNLRLDINKLKTFVHESSDWYTLFISAVELNLSNFSDVRKQEDILIRLLCDYTDRFYKSLKNAYEGQFYDIVGMTEDHGSMLKIYHFEIEDSADGQVYAEKLSFFKPANISRLLSLTVP